MDLFNLNIARQQAEMDIDRNKLVRVEDQEKKGWGSWMKDWIGLSDKSISANSTVSSADIVTQIEQAMTPEEKYKLFVAIDYQVSESLNFF